MKEAGIGSKDTAESLETAPTEFIENAGITFAYRRLGTRRGTPLIFLQHFTGNRQSHKAVPDGIVAATARIKSLSGDLVPPPGQSLPAGALA